MGVPETSVIIRTFNEEKRLPGLLDALSRQTRRDHEIIIVDSGSVDGTLDIAGRHAGRVLRIGRRDFTFGYSLNQGIAASRGRRIAIVSAHTLPLDSNWLGALVRPLEDPRACMVFGRQVGPAGSKYSEVQDMRRTYGPARRTVQAADFIGNNANAAIRRDLWETHAFDETLPGLEDIAWAKYWNERGYDVVYEPDAALYHFHEENWQQIRRRYYREALAAKRIGLKSPGDVWREAGLEVVHLIADLGCLFRETQTPERPKVERCLEIVRFRASKARGIADGLLDGNAMQNQERREQIYFDRACKAVVIRGPGRAQLEDVSVPGVRPGDVLIRVAYQGVCATDLEICDGTLGYYKSGLARYPIVPGHELSGRVVHVGPNVQGITEGDPVVVECIQGCGTCSQCRRHNAIGCVDRAELGVIRRNGGYAEYLVTPGQFVHRLPLDLDLRRACLAEPLAVVSKGLRRLARAWPEEPGQKSCVVVGAGAIGHLCARVLQSRGHRVAVLERDAVRRGLFDCSGIVATDDPRVLSGADVLVEATGNPDALRQVITSSRAGSTILLLGLPYAEEPFNFERVVAYDKTLVGSVGSGPEDFEEAIRILQKLDVDPFLKCIVSLERFEDAWRTARNRQALKVILEVRP